MEQTANKHYIAIVGGSVSGSEAAHLLATKGYNVVVFDMNNLPYGKIEDGLPNWHVGLRDKQEKNIDDKLDHPNITFVPRVKIGSDIPFQELVDDWGFTAVILANGAWKDRKLPVKDIDCYEGKDVIYQNSLVYWFNHKHEPGYDGPQYKIEDGAVVVGGGLASLDVMKIGMIELVQNALKDQKGINVSMFELEKKGIAKVLEEKQTHLKELGISGITLVYRRRAKDMPLKTPKDDTEESKQKAQAVSEKLLQKYLQKFLFKFLPLHSPSEVITHNCSIVGMIFNKMEVKNGKLLQQEDEYTTLKTSQIISSIGSLPEKIEGLPYEGSWLKMKKDVDYMVDGFDRVFAVGNAVTGRGNIQESKIHGRQITERIIDEQLKDHDLMEDWLIGVNEEVKRKVDERIGSIEEFIKNSPSGSENQISAMQQKIKSIHKRIGYTGYRKWIAENTPVRLENLIQ